MKKLYKLLLICLLIIAGGGNALKAQSYNSDNSETANRAETPTYISKIAVAYGAKESTPKDILKNNGFTIIDKDLNDGCGASSHYIYMGYKTTTNPADAITGIFFRTGENPPNSATFDGVTAYLLGGSDETNPGENTYVDLNAKAGGQYIYTYVTRNTSRAAVINGMYFDGSSSASGYVTPNVNLNSGTNGGAIYLHYKQFSGKASATFHYLNSSGSRTSSTTSVSVKHHQQAVNNTPSAPTSVTYDGRTWTLLGWREDNTATTAGSTPSYTYMDSKVYRAVYSANVSLTYNANGGSGVPSTQNATQYINAGSSSIAKSNASITIPATIPTHDATKCNFAGWNTSSSATTAQYQPGNNISIKTNTILYAVWPEHNGTKTYFNIGENHVYTWSCCGKSMTEDHIYDDGIDCDLCDGYPATLVDGYYQINNANELLWFAAYVNYIDKTASAKLMNDIEMNAVQWTPIGTDAAYNGTFDGQGYTINNLWHNTGVADGGREGLFTLIGSNGVVKNIVLNNATIWGGSSYGFNSCGGIAIKNQGTISNCIIAGSTIQFGNYAHFGGIAGHNTGTIKNCAVRNSILRRRWGGVNNRNIGGITQTNNGTVTDCYSYDNIYEYGLTTCAISAEGNAPINSYQYTTSTVADAAETAKTKAQFASGEVAYLLQGEQTTQVWGQNIDNEETAQQYPVFSNAKVYKHTFNGVTLYSNHEKLAAGGKCGDNLFWNVNNNNTLTIYGTGAMYDYEWHENEGDISPWRNLNTAPTSLVLEEGITYIGEHAFFNCSSFKGSLTIPNSVTTIGEYAFYKCKGFNGSLTIGNSVTSIGNYAFDDCSGFTGSLTIGNSVTSIGKYAFENCSGFTGSLTIGNSVTTIGNYAFYSCKGFTGDLTIPNSVTSIGNYAFYKCSGFKGSLTIPNSVTSIGNSAFSSCSGFTGDLTIPNSVTAIEGYAFSGCSGFNGSLTIPNSVTTIGNAAFANCSGFNGSLTIPNSVTTIGNSAFSSCSGFTGSLTIPNSVTTIGDRAFNGCSGFTGSLTIPNSVTTIGKYAFQNCSGFTEVHSSAVIAPTLGTDAFANINKNAILCYPVSSYQSYDENGWFNYFPYEANGKCGDNLYWRVNDNILTIFGTGAMEDYDNIDNKAPWRNLETPPTSLVMEDGITHIGNYAFHLCFGFKGSLTIPNSVTTIGDWAFDECIGFTGSLTIPNSVTTIGDRAFFKCSGFNGSLTIGNSVTTIGYRAFFKCSGFNGSLTIPNSVTTIGNEAFYDCEGFTGSLTIPNSVTSIGDWAFADCRGFTGSLTIPNSVTTIGNYAFRNCSGFTGSLTIPNSVTSIGNYAFYDCEGFTGSLTIGNSVTIIGDYAFQNCSGFKGSLTIPNSVTSIGNYAFYQCSGFDGSLTIGNSVTSIGDYAFYDCEGFTEVYSFAETAPTLGTNAFKNTNENATLYYPSLSEQSYEAEDWFDYFPKHIGYDNDKKCGDNLYWYVDDEHTLTIFGTGAMYDYGSDNNKAPWRSLNLAPKSLVLEEGITHIGNSAFHGCSSFTGSLTIPNSVTTIGVSAFDNCPGFTGDLTIPNNVTSIGKTAFWACKGFTGSLTIPNSVTTIGDYAFQFCDGFTKVYSFAETAPTLGTAAFSGINNNAILYYPASSEQSYDENGWFNYFTKRIGLDKCGDNLYWNVDDTNTLTIYGTGAMYDYEYSGDNISPWRELETAPTSLVLEEGITHIGNSAFDNCSGFNGSLTIPNSVTTIGNEAFYNCSGFDGSLTIGNSVTSIGNYAFGNCSGFKGSLTIPNSVTYIANYAFQYCSGFTGSLTIPNSVTSIGEGAFSGCSSFTGSLTIGNSVKTIGNYAFYYCNGFTEIFFYRDTNPTIGTSVFSGINAKVCVPVIWESFDNIPEDKLVKMATFVGEQSAVSGQQSGWVLPEGMTEVSADEHVAINAPMVISGQQSAVSSQQSVANSLSVKSFGYCGDGTTINGSITIEDGAQLYCEIANGEVTVKKEILGYQQSAVSSQQSESESKWYTIASPLKDTIQIIPNSSFLTSNSDLYRYDEPSYTWQNAKNSANNGFNTIDPSRGYLYANAENTSLKFTGNINTETVTYNLTTDGDKLNGFHLVGNPFTHNITFAHLNATEGASLVNGYYVLNGEGAWGATLGSNEDDVIKVGQGVLVKATAEGTLAIAKTQRRRDAESQSRGQQDNRTTRQQVLEMSVSNAQHSDRAFVVFDKGVGLDKMNHENENIPLLYIPMDDTDYAIAMMDMNVNEIPVSFETKVMGEYTISLRQENCEFDELYLLDKQTCEKVNILEQDYTFIATSSENPERFILMKDAQGSQLEAHSHFAYINNGDIVIYNIEGDADIKIFDALGRCVYHGESSDETTRIANGYSAGVYMIQKVDDKGVNVQKIIL